MTRARTFILALLLSFGLAGVALWAVSYAQVTIARFAWPGGAGEERDRGFLLLVNGRVGVVRQRMNFAPDDPAAFPVTGDFDRERAIGDGSYLAGDARQLGTFIARRSVEQGATRTTEDASMTLTSVAAALAEFSWRKLGYDSAVLASPRMQVEGATVTARVTATVLPLWPIALLAVPALFGLARGRHARRWAAAGRCPGCGYDLRASAARCPECGRDLVPGPVASRVSASEPDAGGTRGPPDEAGPPARTGPM